MLRWIFRQPGQDVLWDDADRIAFARLSVADLRAAYARYPGDRSIEDLVTELLGTSPRFAAMWAAHEVEVRRPIRKRVSHPGGGSARIRLPRAAHPRQRPAAGHLLSQAGVRRPPRRSAGSVQQTPRPKSVPAAPESVLPPGSSPSMARGHTITTRQGTEHVVITLDGEKLAESDRPVLLDETGLPTRYYLPREDVRTDLLQPTDTHTTCPFKGEASYWSAEIGGEVHLDVVWSYESPIPQAAEITGLMCFYPDQVEMTVDGEETG